MSDFIVDDQSWAIHWLIAETSHLLSGKEVLISLSYTNGISYEKSKVFVKLTKRSHPAEAGILRSSGLAGDHGLESEANDTILSNNQR